MTDIMDNTDTLFAWLVRHQAAIEREAKDRDMEIEEFLIFMLDDVLEAYENGRKTEWLNESINSS